MQLGSPEPGPAPRAVVGVTDAVGLALTDGRACAFRPGGEVDCWGDSGGCVDVTTARPPSRVDALRGSRQIVRASGGCFWCALRAAHELTCEPSPYTQQGIVMPRVSTVGAGSDHACATLLDGSVWCWGTNARGELGRRSATERDSQPGPVQWPAGSVMQACKGLTATEVYVEGNMPARRLANIAFHEIMHNKLDVGGGWKGNLHRDAGAGLAQKPTDEWSRLTDGNIRVMSANMFRSVRQYIGGM